MDILKGFAIIALYINCHSESTKIIIYGLHIKQNNRTIIDYSHNFFDDEYENNLSVTIEQYHSFLDEYARSTLRIIKNVEDVPELSIMNIMVRFR